MGVVLDAIPIEIAVLRRCRKHATLALSTYTPVITLTKQYLTEKLAYGLAFSESQAYDCFFM